MVCPDVSTFSALAENVLKRCIEPTGGSPVRVSAGAPGSRVQRGEEILSAERIVESLTKEGAKVRAVTIKSEACSLDRLSAERRKGGPRPSCQGEGERQRGKTGGRAGTPRGIGHGTERRLDAEQERPSSAARRQGRAGTYKAMPKWSWCREMVAKRVSDRRVQKLLRKWLMAGVMEAGGRRESLAGTPQGGVISPLLANIYLHELDRHWRAEGQELGELVRYADDFVVLCKTEWKAKAAHRLVEQQLGVLGLELHPDKTKVVDLRRGRGSFEFLGCTLRKKRSILRNPRWSFLQRWPSPKAMKRVRGRIHELTDRRRAGAKLRDIIGQLNPVLRGWGNYFRSGNADDKFNQVDHYVHHRLCNWLWRRGGQRTRFRVAKWPFERFFGMGLHHLRGTVCYPAQAAPLRPSVSRVRENRTHGLTGDPVSPTSQ